MAIGDYVQNFWRYLTVAATLAILLGAGVFVAESLPPRTIAMATGAEGGANYELGIRYREILAEKVSSCSYSRQLAAWKICDSCAIRSRG